MAGLTAAENVSLPLEIDGLAARKARADGLSALEELERRSDNRSGPGRRLENRAIPA
jgi:predicted ABC-type transport system involved in lysophospholipase L1 biosynthesis ATPase subunit